MHDIRTDAPPPRTALVVGAGIGGLTAAVALRRLGLQVTVLERGAAGVAGGAGLVLWPNALRALEEIGLRGAVEGVGRPVAASAVLEPDGRTLVEAPAAPDGPLLAFHRADLLAVLLAAAGPEHVRYGARAVRATCEEEYAGVVLDDGSELTADVLVAADGVHSALRPAVLDRRAEPAYAGATSWRGVAAVALDSARTTETWGDGERFGVVPLSGGRTYWYATVTGASSTAGHAELVERFSGWHAPIGNLLAATDPAAVIRTDIVALPWLGAWSHERVALLGDAAHAMRPDLGQGAAMAIEDAVVLGRELGRGRRDVETALDAYAALRRPRVQRVMRESARAGRIAQANGCLAVRGRRVLVRSVPARLRERRLQALLDFE